MAILIASGTYMLNAKEQRKRIALLGSHLASGELICPLPALRIPLPRYYYGLAPQVTEQTQVFLTWLRAQCAGPTPTKKAQPTR